MALYLLHNSEHAIGNYGITRMVLKDCADQLTGLFTKIFNLSSAQATLTPCLKTSTIISVSKKKKTHQQPK